MVAALLAFAPPVAAQDASTLKKDMIGQWELATTERSKTCVVTLKGDTAPQGTITISVSTAFAISIRSG